MCYTLYLKFVCPSMTPQKKEVTRMVKKFPEGAALLRSVEAVGCEERLNEPVTRHCICR